VFEFLKTPKFADSAISDPVSEHDFDQQVRHLEIASRRAVTGLLAGEYRSAFKGTGIDAEEIRAYQPGDDVRTMDWNVTARTGEPHVRRYAEERELSVYFLLDMSASGAFGSLARSKRDAAIQIVGLLTAAAATNHDRIGVIFVTDHVEKVIRPAKGQAQARRIYRELFGFKPDGRTTNLSAGFDWLQEHVRRRAVIFALSDFQDEGYQDSLRLCAHRHDLILVDVTDRRELTLPAHGLLELKDAESGSVAQIDCRSQIVRDAYAEATAAYHARLAAACREWDVDLFRICTERDYLHDLVTFFKLRRRRREVQK
jgi:uncharacterized protein (DUF58 family)